MASKSTYLTGKLYTKLKPTVTNTYTIYFTYDDGSKIVFDGATKVDVFGQQCFCSNSFQVTLTGGKYYEIEIFFYQKEDNAKILLEWSSSSISKQTIPSSYYSSPTNVLASPLQVSVS